MLMSLSKFIRPLSSTFNAVRNIIDAVNTIDTLHEQIAYEDAYNSLNKALKNLNRLCDNYLVENDWYNKLNNYIVEFVKDLEFVLIPATFDRTINKEDLEDYAFALYSLDKAELMEVKKTIDDRVAKGIYKKTEAPTTSNQWTTLNRFSENRIEKLLTSIFLGYGVVLIICGIYVYATQQDFMIFARQNPEIIIMGGLIISGITFWRGSGKK